MLLPISHDFILVLIKIIAKIICKGLHFVGNFLKTAKLELGILVEIMTMIVGSNSNY